MSTNTDNEPNRCNDLTDQPTIVVAIPARNEADRIQACLVALSQQQHPPHAVLLLLNNCSDTTASIAQSLSSNLRFDLHSVSHTFPSAQANAGQARRMAMALAAKRAGPDGILLTTDADTIVPPDWVRRNRTALLQGADLVCGRAVIDPIEALDIPAHLHADDARERHLIALLDEIAWIVDPDPHDPLPRHTEASGASLAVWVTAFDRVGGVPAVTTGEDRAFMQALQRIDARIRHDPAIEVVVSGRIMGRAEGGMADTIRRRIAHQDKFADVQVEPAQDALRRVILRRRVRAAWSMGLAGADEALAVDLGFDLMRLTQMLARPFFGAAWAAIEASSSNLLRQPVPFLNLPAEITIAAQLLARMKKSKTLAADGPFHLNDHASAEDGCALDATNVPQDGEFQVAISC